MADFKSEGDRNLDKLKKLVGLAEGYEKRVKEETELSKEQLRTRYVGKVDPKKRTSDRVASHHDDTQSHTIIPLLIQHTQTSRPSPQS